MPSENHMSQGYRISGYGPGHPWYYILGGAVLMPREIRAEVKASGYQSYMAERLNAAGRLSEPKRSERLRAIRSDVLKSFWSDLSRYREVARDLRRFRRGFDPSGARHQCEDVHTSISLKHNHLYNGFATLLYLDDLLSRQRDLFD